MPARRERDIITIYTTPTVSDDESTLETLLERTSRTFAIAIPCLPHPARREVTLAYLLFRIADTIEDGENLTATQKLAALDSFSKILRSKDGSQRTELDLPVRPLDNPNYLELLDQLTLVVNATNALRPQVRDILIRSVQSTIAGMQRFIAGYPDGQARIHSVAELKDYCYVVAGIVGEMLTEVFLHGATWLHDHRRQLTEHARYFGEGLQLVNILKDTEDDRKDGRIFVPDERLRPELFELAREDLRRAQIYVNTLKSADAPAGFIAFTEIPLRLAVRTLECVELHGPGSKVPRHEVLSIVAHASAVAAAGSDERSLS